MSSSPESSPRYAIRDAVEDVPLAEAQEVHGFFAGGLESKVGSRFIGSEDDLDNWTFTLTGLVPTPSLSARIAKDETGSISLGYIEIRLLGTEGEVLGKYSAWDAELVQIDEDRYRITCATAILPDRDAEPVWELWRRGGPAQKNLWTELPAGRRAGWLQVVALNAFASDRQIRAAEPVSEIVLDGENIVDLTSFYLAIGEAVNGPGGYFGWNLDALNDCLRGGWGSVSKPKIRWENFAVAQRNLTQRETLNGDKSTLDIILSVIRDAGAELELN